MLCRDFGFLGRASSHFERFHWFVTKSLILQPQSAFSQVFNGFGPLLLPTGLSGVGENPSFSKCTVTLKWTNYFLSWYPKLSYPLQPRDISSTPFEKSVCLCLHHNVDLFSSRRGLDQVHFSWTFSISSLHVFLDTAKKNVIIWRWNQPLWDY